MNLRASLVVFAAAFAAPAARAWAQGCAMCGNSFAPDDPAARAISTSVVFLLLTPYALLAGVGGWLYLRHRQPGASRRATVIALPWVRAGVGPDAAPEKE